MRIALDPQKQVPAKKPSQNNTPQKFTPFSQIKNSALNVKLRYWDDIGRKKTVFFNSNNSFFYVSTAGGSGRLFV